MKNIFWFLFVVSFCFLVVAPSWATDTFNSDTLIEFSEEDNSVHNYASLPGTVEHPISHYAGPMINTIPADQETPSLYNFKKMLKIQDVISVQEALNITRDTGLASDLVNNMTGYRINQRLINLNTRVQIISFIPSEQIFVPMAEVNPVSKNRFQTPLNRVAWTAIQASRIGADVIYYNCQGLDKKLRSQKFDVGGAGERMATAGSRMLGSVLEMFLTGGTSNTKWLMPGWLSTFVGRLYTKDEMRKFWEFIYDDFRKSGMSVKEYTSQPLINPMMANSSREFEALLNITLKQKWCFNELFKSLVLPRCLWTKEEVKAKSWKKTDLSDLKVSFTGLVIYFDHKSVDLRKDQEENAQQIQSYAKAHGLKMLKNNEIFLVTGLCDGTGPESINWAKYGPKRAFLAARFIVAGLKEIVNQNGKRILPDSQIKKMVKRLSGGENNPLTTLLPEDIKKQSERVTIIFRAKQI